MASADRRSRSPTPQRSRSTTRRRAPTAPAPRRARMPERAAAAFARAAPSRGPLALRQFQHSLLTPPLRRTTEPAQLSGPVPPLTGDDGQVPRSGPLSPSGGAAILLDRSIETSSHTQSCFVAVPQGHLRESVSGICREPEKLGATHWGSRKDDPPGAKHLAFEVPVAQILLRLGISQRRCSAQQREVALPICRAPRGHLVGQGREHSTGNATALHSPTLPSSPLGITVNGAPGTLRTPPTPSEDAGAGRGKAP